MNSSGPRSDPFDAVFPRYRASCDDEPVTAPLAPGPSTELDRLRSSAAETRSDSATVRWYIGLDAAGAFRIGRQLGRLMSGSVEIIRT